VLVITTCPIFILEGLIFKIKIGQVVITSTTFSRVIKINPS
jgi:hypothetical protein